MGVLHKSLSSVYGTAKQDTGQLWHQDAIGEFFAPSPLEQLQIGETAGITNDAVLSRDIAFATFISVYYGRSSFTSCDAARPEYELNLELNQ